MKKLIFTIFLLTRFYSGSLLAQEVRVQGTMMILGYIDGAFLGAGAGIEAPLGTHFSLNFDVNWASQEVGSTIEIRPAVNYYFGKEQHGLFVGAAAKYISLKEADDQERWDDDLYSIGFNLGFKALLSDAWILAFTASPHKTVGGTTESDVAGISAQVAVGYRF